jgi:hypothetical protein
MADYKLQQASKIFRCECGWEGPESDTVEDGRGVRCHVVRVSQGEDPSYEDLCGPVVAVQSDDQQGTNMPIIPDSEAERLGLHPADDPPDVLADWRKCVHEHDSHPAWPVGQLIHFGDALAKELEAERGRHRLASDAHDSQQRIAIMEMDRADAAEAKALEQEGRAIANANRVAELEANLENENEAATLWQSKAEAAGEKHCQWRKESQDQSTLEDCHLPATHGNYCEAHDRMENHHGDGRGQ